MPLGSMQTGGAKRRGTFSFAIRGCDMSSFAFTFVQFRFRSQLEMSCLPRYYNDASMGAMWTD